MIFFMYFGKISCFDFLGTFPQYSVKKIFYIFKHLRVNQMKVRDFEGSQLLTELCTATSGRDS